MMYNIVASTDSSKTVFLSELFTSWVDVSKRGEAISFPKDQLDYLIPLIKSENEDLFNIAYFPTHIKWEDINGNLF